MARTNTSALKRKARKGAKTAKKKHAKKVRDKHVGAKYQYHVVNAPKHTW